MITLPMHSLSAASVLAVLRDSFSEESISARFGELLLKSLAIVAITALIAWLASVLVRFLFEALGAGAPCGRLLGKVALLVVLVLGLIALLGVWGVDTTGLGLLVMYGVLGLFLFGCYAALAPLRCLIAGASVRYGAMLKEGDALEQGELCGRLLELGAFQAVLELEDGSELVLPNTDLFQGHWRRRR